MSIVRTANSPQVIAMIDKKVEQSSWNDERDSESTIPLGWPIDPVELYAACENVRDAQ